MDCLHPIHIKNDVGYQTVPCGRCAACITRKRNEWGFRIKQEAHHSKSVFFFTLTYDEQNVPLGEVQGMPIPCVDKRDVQLFLKKLRKHFEKKCKLRYFIASEYGPSTLRPHYHGIVFFPDAEVDLYVFSYCLEKSWNNGFVTCAPVNDSRIFYVADYLFDKSINNCNLVPNFMLSSRRPGIGAKFLDNSQNVRRITDDLLTYVNYDDKLKIALPEYYKRKLLTPEQRNELNIQNIIRHSEKEIEYQKKFGLYDKELHQTLENQFVQGFISDEYYYNEDKTMKEQINEAYVRAFYKKSKSNKI